MQFNNTQTTLLTLLGDGACHSGSELGQTLGITRSAVWKQMKQLIGLGVPVITVPNQGYQLERKFILLDEQKIKAALDIQHISTPFTIHLFTSIDSTNRFLKDLPQNKQLDICCAEIQTQGRGRFGRHWHSPFGDNIYCSSRWNLNYDLSKLSGLGLVTSLAVLAALNELQLSSDIKIKWPNDIYWHDKKLCGSLIEIQAESNADAQVIIGIGLNVNIDTQKHHLPGNSWCSLYEIAKRQFDRNQLIAALIGHLERYLHRFIQYDLQEFIEEWDKFDYLAGKEISIHQPSGVLTGTACGINHWGQLILKDTSGKVHFLSSGDTSLKNAP